MYSHTGRPSVDPELLIRMLLVGYCFGIGPERRLCEEGHLNLAYRWFCRLDLSDRVPDHPTFSKNRHGRFRASELLRHLFEMTVARCIEEGLVSGQRMAIDASLIEADANRQNSTPKKKWEADRIDPDDAPRAVREYLDTLDGERMNAIGQSECANAFGAASEVEPKFPSYSDPASQWTAAAIRTGSIVSAAARCPSQALIWAERASWSHRKTGKPEADRSRGNQGDTAQDAAT